MILMISGPRTSLNAVQYCALMSTKLPLQYRPWSSWKSRLRRTVRSERAAVSKFAICACMTNSTQHEKSVQGQKTAYMVDDFLPICTIAVQFQMCEMGVGMRDVDEQVVVGTIGVCKIDEFET